MAITRGDRNRNIIHRQIPKAPVRKGKHHRPPLETSYQAAVFWPEMGQVQVQVQVQVQSPPEYVNKHVTHPPRVAYLLGQLLRPAHLLPWPGLAYLRLSFDG